MLRDDAVARINDGLGFRPAGHSLTDAIIRRLQEAQRDLEKGKTLPRFLKVQNFIVSLAAGDHQIPFPPGWLRFNEDEGLRYTSIDTFLPVFLDYVPEYKNAVQRVVTLQRPGEPQQTVTGPKVFTFRNATIDFITTADKDYDLRIGYYGVAEVLTTNIENLWLASAPEWLIGEAGYRIALDLRDDSSMKLFDDMRQRARAAIFGDDIAYVESGGPYVMGAQH